MAGRLARGWSMARASASVLRRYPKLVVLPMISGTVMLLAVGVVASSLFPQSGSWHAGASAIWDKLGADWTPLYYVALFAALFVLSVISIFFNAALIHCALRCHAGEEPSVRAGLAAAVSRLPQILGWALVAATVGVVLEAIQSVLKDNLGFLGSLIGGLFNIGWAALTYFVLPVLVTEGVGPITAIRRSSAILRSKWGESLAGEARFGLLGILFFLLALLVFFVGLALSLSYGPAAMAALGPILMVLAVVFAIATMVVLQTLGAIFQAGVFIYANTGQVPRSLDPELIEGAFRSKS